MIQRTIHSRGQSRSQLRARFIWLVSVVCIAFAVLIIRLLYLQVFQGQRYSHLSENNRVRIERLSAPRGMILDRRGEILADVRAAFNAVVIPAEIPDEGRGRIYEELSAVLSMTVDEIRERVERRSLPRWKPRILKRRLDRDEMARLEAHRLELPGVAVQASPVRNYPFEGLLGSVLGYVGEISPAELSSKSFIEKNYESGDFVGRSGIEAQWEDSLRGVAGWRQVEADARGRRLQVLSEQPPLAGNNIYLTIDKRIQETAEKAMGENVGALVAVDVLSGEVLAMVSNPGFDPNMLSKGVSSEDWSALLKDPLKPLQNRVIQGQYPPGSTFKIAAALIGLAVGAVDPSTTYFCNGEYRMKEDGRAYRCWKKFGHGKVDLETALVESCDVYFYQLAHLLEREERYRGVNNLYDWGRRLGLGSATGIDLPGEKTGLLPSREWKLGAIKERWYSGETLSVIIGQGFMLATPLQLAVMTASVAHPEGRRLVPRMVIREEDSAGKILHSVPTADLGAVGFRKEHLEVVRRALRKVVSTEKGTGKKAEVEGFPVAGKTGTSQVRKMPQDENKVDEETIPWKFRDHALFVAYAPADSPRIAVAAIVEHGGHGGSVAAPPVQKVIAEYSALISEEASLGEAMQ